MTKKRRMFDIDLPEEAALLPDETFPAGKVSEPPARRGPMAAAIAETVDLDPRAAEIEAQIRAENDALAHEHVRLKRLGLVIDLVPLDLIEMTKLVRDRKKGPDSELAELKASIPSWACRTRSGVEARADGRFELIQGYRRLSAYRELLDETGDADRYGTHPGRRQPAGRRSRGALPPDGGRKPGAEGHLLCRDGDAGAGLCQRPWRPPIDDPDKAVAVLFQSAGYQKRSYIRTFMTVVDRLGTDLLYPQDIPRALGLALARRLDEVDGLAPVIRAELKGWDNRSVTDEIGHPASLCGRGGRGRGWRRRRSQCPPPGRRSLPRPRPASSSTARMAAANAWPPWASWRSSWTATSPPSTGGGWNRPCA